jgi:hypothetical protein
MRPIEDRIRELPPNLQEEVIDFIEFLAQRENRKPGKMRQDWANGLAGYRDQYTSIQLQKKALDWRQD